MSFKEFYKFYCPSKIKKNINAAAIMLYCCSALNFLLFFVSAKIGISGLVSVVDAVLVLGLALGVHIGKGRACAVIVLVYSILNCLYCLVTKGQLGGYVIIIAGVYATIFTFMARREYKEFIRD